MLLALGCGGQKPPAEPRRLRCSGEVADQEATRTAQPSEEATRAATMYFDHLVGEYLAKVVLRHKPELATELGLYSEDARLNTRTLDGQAAEARDVEEFAAMAEAARVRPATRWSDEQKTDLKLLANACRTTLLRAQFLRPLERMPSVYTAPMNALFLMSARDYAPAPERAKNMLERIRQIPGVVAIGKANLEDPPRSWVKIGIDAANSAGKFFDGQRGFLVGALPAQAKDIDVALNSAKAAYVDYARFLQAMLPKAKPDFAIGAEAFSKLLEAQYGLTEPLSVTKARGQQVFERTQAEMAALARQIDPNAKDVAAVIAALKLKHPKASELLKAYSDETARARAFLVAKDAIAMPEGDDLSIIDTPVFQRGTVQAAYDQPPPFGAVSKGFFFVTPVDPRWPAKEQESWLRENDHGDIVDTAVHEAYPGHHLQLSFARQHKSVIRKVQDAAIFSEGWALYSEELMNELGYYTSEERMLQLEWTLVRAARVLIDIGLHTEGMTEKQAADLLVNEVHLERKLAENEVRRYTQDPTQPLAYLTGREQLFELRGKYKARQGGSYSLKAWHSEVLSHGTIAPAYIAAEMGL